MLGGVSTVTGNLRLGVYILFQIIACCGSIDFGQTVGTADESLQGLRVGIGPGVAVSGNGSLQAQVAVLVSLHQILRGAVATLTTGTGTRHTYGEVVLLEGSRLREDAACENNLLQSLSIAPVGTTLEESGIVG